MNSILLDCHQLPFTLNSASLSCHLNFSSSEFYLRSFYANITVAFPRTVLEKRQTIIFISGLFPFWWPNLGLANESRNENSPFVSSNKCHSQNFPIKRENPLDPSREPPFRQENFTFEGPFIWHTYTTSANVCVEGSAWRIRDENSKRKYVLFLKSCLENYVFRLATLVISILLHVYHRWKSRKLCNCIGNNKHRPQANKKLTEVGQVIQLQSCREAS